MLKIGISGIDGKMGRRIADLADKNANIEIASALEREGHSIIGKEAHGIVVTSKADEACRGIDSLIDFTLPESTLAHVEACLRSGVAMVIGTTGLDAKGEAKIKEASKTIPIVFSPNMAIGVNVLFNIVAETAQVLGKDFSIKVDETHHVHKKDSPSGTAKMIARVIKEVSGTEVPIEAFRKGEVIGNHGIVFDGEYETLEVRHDAKSRDVFAAGALKAAEFLAGKKPGLYTMKEVLGLERKA